MICSCGGVFLVIRIEKVPSNLLTNEKLSYSRLCDVECVKCGKVHYSQPFDGGNNLTIAKKIEK